MQCLVSMYLSRRNGFVFSVLSLPSKHGVASVPALLEHCLMSFFFFFLTLLNTNLYLEYLFPLEHSDPIPQTASFHVKAYPKSSSWVVPDFTKVGKEEVNFALLTRPALCTLGSASEKGGPWG